MVPGPSPYPHDTGPWSTQGPSACPHAAIELGVFNAPALYGNGNTLTFVLPVGSPGLTHHTISLLVNSLGTEFSLTCLSVPSCDDCSQHSLADTRYGCSDCFSFHYKYIQDKKAGGRDDVRFWPWGAPIPASLSTPPWSQGQQLCLPETLTSRHRE